MSIFEEAVRIFGFEAQLKMVEEECAELINAICKYYRGRNTSADIIEEAVDVSFMIEQLKFIFPSEMWESIRRDKENRLKARLAKHAIS